MYTLKPYQLEARNFLLMHPSAGLFLPPGLGKTLVTLDALYNVLSYSTTKPKVLIIAPIRVMYMVWRQEIAKWGFNFSVGILHGKDKSAVLNETHDIYIINPEGLKWLFNENLNWLKRYPFMLVIDESTMFKNHGTVRFMLMKRYRHLFDRHVILTGTPAPNSLMQLWSQIFILDGGKRLGSGITKFRNRYCMLPHPGSFEYEIIPGKDREIYAAIEDIVLHKSKAELNLPPLVNNTIEITLPDDAQKLYKQIRVNSMADTENLTAVNAAARGAMLKQIANGTVYNDVGGVANIHTTKLEALQELIDTLAGNPLLVMYEYNHDLARLKGMLDNPPHIGGGVTGAHLDSIIDRWNRGEIPVLLLQPQAGGHGLNLQSGGCTDICWYSITFDLELYDQAIARVYRQGVSGSVTVHHIVAENTIDERVMKVLQQKGDTQQALLDYLLEK